MIYDERNPPPAGSGDYGAQPPDPEVGNSMNGAQPPEILSTHPADSTRINSLNRLLPKAVKVYESGQKRYGLGENLY